MTQADRHKEIMRILMAMLAGKRPEPPERARLAELAGFKRGGKGAPSRTRESALYIKDSDFKTAETMKLLAERILSHFYNSPRTIWLSPDPVQKPGRPVGSYDKSVKERRIETVHLVQADLKAGKPKIASCIDHVKTRSDRTDETGHFSKKRVAIRDYNIGISEIAAEQDSLQRQEQYQEQTSHISNSLHYVFKKHTNTRN